MLKKLGTLAFIFFLIACQKEIAPVHSTKEALATFELAEDYDIQLVASEPMVEDPVAMTFDELGRLWVVEMRGYMPNIDGTGENEKVGRIKILIDQDHDGVMDSSVVFLDSLELPRSLAIVKGGALVAERVPLWYVEDTDGDLKADKKILIDSVYGGRGMPEHSPNGLWRGFDNWYYNAKSSARYKKVAGEWIKEETEFRGQWGISHDNLGRLYYNYNWSQLHGDLVPPNYLSHNENHTPTSGIDHGLTIDRKIFPIRPNPATNRGYIEGTLNAEGKLLEFTSACAPFVYRGSALPQFLGNVFVAEPAGNLIKRNVVDDRSPILAASSPYADRDFLASTDERFRPVFFTSGPDGALYIADMYRGLIEHGPYMSEYLKEQTLARGLVHPIHLGRIWRIVPKNFKEPQRLVDDNISQTQLVALLDHQDGWYRDVAQRLIVEEQDTLVIPLLRNLVSNASTTYGKIHALYTLQGLEKMTVEICRLALAQPEVEVQVVALRLMEPFALQNLSVAQEMSDFSLAKATQNDHLTLQIALSAYALPSDFRLKILQDIFLKDGHTGLMRDAILSSLQDLEYQMLANLADVKHPKQKASLEIFLEMLATAATNQGDPKKVAALLQKVSIENDSLNWQQQAILRGATMSSVAKASPIPLMEMPRIINQTDLLDPSLKNRVDKLSMMLSWPGHYPDTAEAKSSQLLTVEEEIQFTLGRQHYMTSCSGCHGSEGEGLKRFAPPLAGSEWVLGDEARLALLVLHGVEGPIEVAGKVYGSPDILPVMPSHSILDDETISSILTYIRCEWGHKAGPVKMGTVSRLRHRTQGRVQPWKVDALNEHIKKQESI